MDERTDQPSLPCVVPGTAIARREALASSARTLLGLGLVAALGGCASSGGGHASGDERRSTEELLDRWSKDEKYSPIQRGGATPAPAGGWTAQPVRSRSTWAGEAPVPRLMERMQPVTRITLHHDGMKRFTATGEREVAAHIELIRRGHRTRNFGDIGYHYLIDPAGRVWEGRQLTWQGAHVANQNPGNLGICCLGNFEEQSPSEAQLRAVEAFTLSQMRRFNVPVSRIYTHRELAATACPGRNLQPRLLSMRQTGTLARA